MNTVQIQWLFVEIVERQSIPDRLTLNITGTIAYLNRYFNNNKKGYVLPMCFKTKKKQASRFIRHATQTFVTHY